MKPKLIMLGGFAGSGKTTIANRYVTEHPLAMSVEGDEIITKLGQWRKNTEEAVACKVALVSVLVETHLKRGHDVILPYLLTNSQDAEHFEFLTHAQGADFYEVTLLVEKEEAIRRLFERGTWGEGGLPPLTEADRPRAEKLYESMMEAVSTRPNMIYIQCREGDIEGVYSQMNNFQPSFFSKKIDWEKLNTDKKETGLKGEELVVKIEREYLEFIDKAELASRVRHVSVEEGDGLGYDVLSFFEDGREKYIEVKSTTQSLQSPFYISNNELNFLKQNLECSFIYRIFVTDDYIDENNFLVLTGRDILEESELVPQSYMVRKK